MREAFDAVVAKSEEAQSEKAEAEARVADLDEELARIAASKARHAETVIPPPKKPRSGWSSGTSKVKPRSPKRKRKT
jgi:hypothetical protein